MFETIENQYGNLPTQTSDKNLVITFPLLMRLFEWCHEDAVDDMAIHRVMEKLMAFNDGKNPLGMDVYESLVNCANEGTYEVTSDDCEIECPVDSICQFDSSAMTPQQVCLNGQEECPQIQQQELNPTIMDEIEKIIQAGRM